MNYQTTKQEHLANYKKQHLTQEHGIWSGNGKTYPYILPKNSEELNILQPIRTDFWDYFRTVNIKLHKDFHHLNSSQALCFNLFYPLFRGDLNNLTFALFRILEANPPYQVPFSEFEQALEIKDKKLGNQRAVQLDQKFLDGNEPVNWEFEKILDSSEYTNFDFYVELPDNFKVLVELKYTEAEFGNTKADEAHLTKYAEIYEPKLRNLIFPEYLNSETVLTNYQIFRNLSYIDDRTTVIFLFPEQNEQLKGTEDFINKVLFREKLKNVRIVYLEDFVEQLMNNEHLVEHRPTYQEFKAKYIG